MVGKKRHLEHLRTHYQVEGLDVSDDLVSIARGRCPDVTFHVADLSAFDLGRTFDVVACLFSAIAYARTVDNLDRTVACLARHTAPGGLVFLEPYFTPSMYRVRARKFNVADTTGWR